MGTTRGPDDVRSSDAIEAARLRLLQFAATHPLSELLEETIDEAERLSGSLIGFFHFVDEDQRSVTLQSWSTRTRAEFCKVEGSGRHYAIADAGVWVDCVHRREPVIHNDYASLPHRKGMPDGHATVVRELAVPVLRGPRVVAIVGVGNKAADYTAADAEALSLLADLAWEISDRKRSEEALRRLNRELLALGECHQALLRATDEQAIVKDVCRIVCERAGYRLAWVGYLEHDQARSIRPVAVAGVDDGYVAAARLSWAEDGERGRGPAGVAVRSGVSVVVQDIRSTPEFQPWLERALARGYRSGIWMPLRDELGAVFGLLLIYSAETGVFSKEEVRLLEQLAADLGFGIMVLRGRARRAEAEQSTALLSFALNNVREAAFLADERARLRYVNDAACRLLGYTRDELLDRSVADIDPDFPAARWPHHWRELREQRTLVFEGRHRTRDGRVFPVEISANYFEYLGLGYNLALVRDITERKRQEEALRSSERRYRTAQAIGRVGNWEYDLVTTQYWGSGEAQRIFGFDPARPFTTREEVERCMPERARVHQALLDLVERGKPYDLEYEIHPQDGSAPRMIASVAEVERDEHGTPVRVTGVIQDITEHKRAEAALRRVEDQLHHAQKMEALGTLAGGVAHDFNNLLTGIIGYASLVQEGLAPDDPLQAALEQILTASNRAAQLTRGLLTLSRKQILNPRNLDLNEAVRGVEKLLRRVIGEDVELSLRLTAGPLVVKADAGQLEQVLLNLASNARDAMPEGGLLTIATDSLALDGEAAAAAGCEHGGLHARLSVSDTGLGMDEATREKAFEPFFTTKGPGRGTGLGLAIVYGIVKQHGGSIEVLSEPGKGSTFRMLLPRVASDVEAEQARPAPARSEYGSELILLAEDDRIVRSMIGTALETHGYRVIETVDGADALEKFAAHRDEVDLLILDVVMPRKSGREVYDAVRAARPDAPVLFLSGYTADIIHQRGILDQGLNFMPKPLTAAELLARVRGLLDGRAPAG